MNSFYNSLNTQKAALLKPLFVVTGSYLAYVLLLMASVLILRINEAKKRLYYIFLSALSVIISWGVISSIMKVFWYLPRPFVYFKFDPMVRHGLDSGLPSDHMAFFVPLALVVFEINKKWGTIAIILTVVMGIGRVFLGLHWPTDILTGIIVGIAGYGLAKLLLPKRLIK